MKKIILGIILLLAAIVLITPLFVGIAAEKKIDTQIANISKSANITISNAYKRNWFSSNSESSFNLSQILAAYGFPRVNAASDSGKIIVKTRSEIIHGPFPLKRFYSKQPIVKPVLCVVKSVTKIIPYNVLNFTPTITTYFSIDSIGGGQGVFSIPGMDYADNVTVQQLKSGKINGNFSFTPDMSILFFDFFTPEILLKNYDKTVNINGLSGSWHSNKRTGGINIVGLGLGINKLTTGKTEINNTILSNSYEEKGGNLFFSTDISVMSLKDNNFDFGPAEIKLSGKRIKKDVYKQLTSLLKDLNSESENQFAHILLMTQIMGLLPDLLSESPEINLDKFKINTPEGLISANGGIKVDKSKLINPNDLKGIIKSISFDFSITIPDNIAEKYIFDNENLRSIMLQKMMVKDNENYTLNLKYKESQFFVNGKPFSPDSEN